MGLKNKMFFLLSKLNENTIAILLLVLAVSTRFFPHPANFTAIAAMALFAGVYLKRNQAVWLPLIAMIVSDIFIGMHSLVLLTWGSFVLIAFIGLWIRKHKNIPNVVFGTITGSLLFFFITNFAVWAFTPLYTKTFQGLMQCFVMAIPFFRNSLAGDLLYVGVLFGSYEGARYMLKNLKKSNVLPVRVK